jgi:hypothetical protein
VKRIDLTKIFDKGVWISDDRVTALISSKIKGIAQVDYHGKQPVSRNARVFLDTSGVFKFVININHNGKNYKKEISFDKIYWSPDRIKTLLNINKIRFELNIVLANDSLILLLEAENNSSQVSLVDFDIIWSKKSQTTDVQGSREWKESDIGKNYIGVIANDKIIINEWLKRTGDYQGDFLIPEKIRRKIYKTHKLSGQAKYEDLKNEYKDKKVFLYNSFIHALMGGKGVKIKDVKDRIIFRYSKTLNPKQQYKFNSFILSFGDSGSALRRKFDSMIKDDKRYFQILEKLKRETKRTLPKILIEGHPEISDFFTTVPGIIESAEVKSFKMIRACASSYYWLWAWDGMVTARALSIWNNLELQKGIIDFIKDHRDIDGSIPQQWTRLLEPMDNRGFGVHDFLLALLMINHYSSASNIKVLKENYPQLLYSLKEIYKKCNTNGIYTTIGMYPDLPLKLGRDKNGFTAMEEASLYSFSILLQNVAYLLGDSPSVEKSNELIEKLKKNFIKLFFDSRKKFVVDFIDKDFQQNKTYPLYSLLFLLYPLGISLIREKLEEIAEFILENHFEKSGIALLPKWDKNRLSETATSSWYPFWDILVVKVFRRTNNGPAIKRWLELVGSCYGYFGFCPEYVSLETEVSGKMNWKSRGTPWNLNCTAGWYQSIIEGVFGIEEDVGGITYIPTEPIFRKQKLSGVYLRGIKTDLEICGKGQFVKNIIINTEKLTGILKIPNKYFESGNIDIKINHCEEMPEIMIKEINGGAVRNYQNLNKEILVEFEGFGYVEIVFISKLKPELIIDDVKIAYEWNSKNSAGHVFSFLPGKHLLKLIKRTI